MSNFIEIKRASNSDRETINVHHIVRISAKGNSSTGLITLSNGDAISTSESYTQLIEKLNRQ